MPVEVIMPKVDMDMDTGQIVQWHIDDGGHVESGAPLLDIETDKATMEVESPASGTLRLVTGATGTDIPIGECIARIYTEDEVHADDEVMAPVASETAPASGTTSTLETAPASETTSAAATAGVAASATTELRPRATPMARRVARLNSIELAQIVGTGPRGRITRIDVEQSLAHQVRHNNTSTNLSLASGDGSTTVHSAPDTDHTLHSTSGTGRTDVDTRRDNEDDARYRLLPLSPMRRTIAARLTHSAATIPQFDLSRDIELDALIALRREINSGKHIGFAQKTSAADVDPDTAVGAPPTNPTSTQRLSLNDLLIRAAAMTFQCVPKTNVSWDDAGIRQYDHADIAVAVALDDGLITPVIRAAETKSVFTISQQMRALSERARSGGLSRDEYRGSTFSISNLGMLGIRSFNAIINPPESMILAVGGARDELFLDQDGQMQTRQVLSVTLTCDHRVVDGALGARWLQVFAELVESGLPLVLPPEAFDQQTA